MTDDPDIRQDLGGASTTPGLYRAKIKRPRRATGNVALAPPLACAKVTGLASTVTVSLGRLRGGAEAWIRVSDHRGEWFVNADCAVGDLVTQLIKGGHYVRRKGASTT